MSQVLAARVTCPNCQNQFHTPIEQVLDVRADPNAKMRVLNGLVNVAICPHCRAGGPLNLPFFYHDPDKELALVYMPMEAGQDNIQREQAIGDFTRTVMNSLPPEERKAYLLQPQVFLTLENLVSKIFEADGITEEMIEEQKAKAELLRRMLEADSDEALEAMIKENADAVDAGFFRLLSLNMEMVQAAGLQKLVALREKLLDLTSEGQRIKARGEAMEALRAEPTREKLLELLIEAPDEDTREILVVFGRPMLDYSFFQDLTSRIESAPDRDEKVRLTALRKEILAVRDRIDEETRALYEERSALLRDLLLSDDPEELARRRFPELDQAFLNVLAANLEEARSEGDEDTVESLQAIWGLVMQLMEETLPPEVRLFNQLISAEDDTAVEKLLQENRDLVTERLVQFMERVESSIQEQGSPEIAARLLLVLEKAKEMVAEQSSD
jgi:hypothetical protein